MNKQLSVYRQSDESYSLCSKTIKLSVDSFNYEKFITLSIN
jgi:hypothetical protein